MASKRQKNELGKLADNLSTGRADNAPSTVPSLGPEAAAGLDGPGFGSLSAAIVLPPPGTHVKLLDGGEWWSGRVERHAPAGLIVAFLDSDEKLTAEWYGKKAPRCTNGSCATIAYEDVAESLKVCRRAKATRAAKSESAGERRGRAQKIEKEAPDSSRGQCAGCGASLCRSAPAAAAHCKQGVQGAGKPGAGKPAHDQRCKQRWIERVQGGAVVSKYCNLTCAGREHDNVDVKLSHGRPDHLGATFRRAAPPPQSFSSSSSSSSPPGIEVASSKRRHTAEQASLIEKASLIEAHVRARLEAQLRAQLRAELKAELKAEVEAARVAAQRKAEAKAEAPKAAAGAVKGGVVAARAAAAGPFLFVKGVRSLAKQSGKGAEGKQMVDAMLVETFSPFLSREHAALGLRVSTLFIFKNYLTVDLRSNEAARRALNQASSPEGVKLGRCKLTLLPNTHPIRPKDFRTIGGGANVPSGQALERPASAAAAAGQGVWAKSAPARGPTREPTCREGQRDAAAARSAASGPSGPRSREAAPCRERARATGATATTQAAAAIRRMKPQPRARTVAMGAAAAATNKSLSSQTASLTMTIRTAERGAVKRRHHTSQARPTPRTHASAAHSEGPTPSPTPSPTPPPGPPVAVSPRAVGRRRPAKAAPVAGRAQRG
mmetsp:Transcript_41899/g.94650  ORF Transcript_41899/g.94650 Transcript_41899/m.94650 type:complete len:662 (+) Transcript_41899:79-2064(+)